MSEKFEASGGETQPEADKEIESITPAPGSLTRREVDAILLPDIFAPSKEGEEFRWQPTDENNREDM